MPGTPNNDTHGTKSDQSDNIMENVSIKFGNTHKWAGGSETKPKHLTLD